MGIECRDIRVKLTAVITARLVVINNVSIFNQ